MRQLILIFFCSIFYLSAHSQTVVSQTVHRTALDTNIVAYDENGNELRFYQYIKLLNSGQYTLVSKGDPGTKAVSYLKKVSPERAAQLYAFIKARMVIKSPLLQEGSTLDVSPLLAVFKNKELDNKAIVLIFWNSNCPPCTDSFSSLNDFFKSIADRKDIIVIALNYEDEQAAAQQLKVTPLLYTQIKNNAKNVIDAYQLDSYPSYMLWQIKIM